MNNKVAEEINTLRSDKVHGASWLSRQAISILNSAIIESRANIIPNFVDEVREAATELTKARPGMVSIANYIHTLLHEILIKAQNEKQLDTLKSFALAKGNELIELSEEATATAIGYGSAIIGDQDIVITCSYSSTVCKAFESAKQRGTTFQVVTAESKFEDKVYGEITAEQLKQHRIQIGVIRDEDIYTHISRAKKALVGADSILSDGSLINGIPSYILAKAAAKAKIPLYTICETAKFDIHDYLAEKSEPEPGFDKISPNLITGMITEKGVIETSLVIAYINERGHLSQPT